jgi:mannose/fructose-specific phosphotransferase system component IIA
MAKIVIATHQRYGSECISTTKMPITNQKNVSKSLPVAEYTTLALMEDYVTERLNIRADRAKERSGVSTRLNKSRLN